MIIAIIEELFNVVFLGKSELDELRIDSRVDTFLVADGDTAAVLGDVRYQDEEL